MTLATELILFFLLASIHFSHVSKEKIFTLDIVYYCEFVYAHRGCRECIHLCISVCLYVCMYIWPLRISKSERAGKFLMIFCISCVLFWPRPACNLRYLQTVTTTKTTTWCNHELVRSSDSNSTSSPSIQTGYKSGLYHAFKSAMLQKVENVISYVLHILGLIIVVQNGNEQFCNTTTRFLVFTNNT
jgi:hypothetical protein